MLIYVKTLTGNKTEFTVEGSDKVIDLKKELQEKEGIEADQIRLIFEGKQLKDNDTLETWKIKAGSVVHMVLQLRGGL